MKKFTKVCLILAACLLALGTVFCITGLAMGADITNIPVGYDPREHRFLTVDDEEIEASYEEHFVNIEELSVDIGNTDINIIEGTSDEFVVKAVNVSRNFSCKQDKKELKIKHEQKTKVLGLDFSGLEKTSSIVLEVPKGTIFKEMDLELGVGSLYAENIHTQDLEGECGVGDFHFQGRVDGTCKLDCGVGSMYVELEGQTEDFNYEIECGIGEINLGGSSFSGLGQERRIQNNAVKKMEIECGIGEVTVCFQDEDTSAQIHHEEDQEHHEEEQELHEEELQEALRKKEEYEEMAREYAEKYEELKKELE